MQLTAEQLRLMGLYAPDGTTGTRNADGSVTVRSTSSPNRNGFVGTFVRALMYEYDGTRTRWVQK